MKNNDRKNQNQKPSPRPVRVLGADALKSVQGGINFTAVVTKSSP